MKNRSVVMIWSFVSLFASFSFADWTSPVKYLEIDFPCQRMTPDFAGEPDVNVSAMDQGEVRVPPKVFSVQGSVVFFLGARVGTLVDQPSCEVDDTGEAPHPNWNEIKLDSTASMKLASKGPSYTLLVSSSDGEKLQFSW